MSGLVVDSASNQPVEYATISQLDNVTHQPITGSVSNAQGLFKIKIIKAEDVTILVEAIGFLPFQMTFQYLDKNKIRDLGIIRLKQKISTLQGVTVTGGPKLIENRIDKMVFNAENDLTSQGGVVTDILKKIPQVSVDVDGNVELAGSSSIRFLIDGKPSTAFGSNIADVLQSIPASQIKSIEVITNPGARYDAEGLGGIINIILKHNLARGINGNTSITVASRNENGSINLSVRDGKLGINVFADANARLPAITPLTSRRVSQDTSSKTQVILDQNGSSDFKRYGVETGLTVDYTFWKKNSLTFSLSSNYFGSSNKGSQNQSQSTIDYNGNLISQVFSLSETQSDTRLHTINMSLDYKRKFDKEDQELEIGIHSSTDHNNYNSVNTQTYLPENYTYYGTNNNNPGRETQTEIVLDYTQPIGKKIIWGMGGKLVLTDIHSTSNVLTLQPASGIFVYDSTLSNYLRYQQQVYALYTELGFPVSDLFETKIGLRYERTALNPFFSDIPQQISEPGYNTFVPSLFLSRKINEKYTLKLSYSKRIERPDYRDLNPFINTTDPYNIITG
ncbi:MAG TPA: TonB-dependent receptor, partial [Puia sp.]|nr:TonB-dependent receptor [Puia sp.]